MSEKFKCGICGAAFKTKSRMVTRYYDYEPTECLEYYPVGTKNCYPVCLKNYICNNCNKELSKKIKNLLIEDAQKYLSTFESRKEDLRIEYEKKLLDLDMDKELLQATMNTLNQTDDLLSLPESVIENIRHFDNTRAYFRGMYYFENAIDREKEMLKLQFKDFCTLLAIPFERFPDDINIEKELTLNEFKILFSKCRLPSVSFLVEKEIHEKVEKLTSSSFYDILKGV